MGFGLSCAAGGWESAGDAAGWPRGVVGSSGCTFSMEASPSHLFLMARWVRSSSPAPCPGTWHTSASLPGDDSPFWASSKLTIAITAWREVDSASVNSGGVAKRHGPVPFVSQDDSQSLPHKGRGGLRPLRSLGMRTSHYKPHGVLEASLVCASFSVSSLTPRPSPMSCTPRRPRLLRPRRPCCLLRPSPHLGLNSGGERSAQDQSLQ